VLEYLPHTTGVQIPWVDEIRYLLVFSAVVRRRYCHRNSTVCPSVTLLIHPKTVQDIEIGFAPYDTQCLRFFERNFVVVCLEVHPQTNELNRGTHPVNIAKISTQVSWELWGINPSNMTVYSQLFPKANLTLALTLTETLTSSDELSWG